MATAAPQSLDSKRCHSCHRGEVWYVCQDCDDRLLCKKCYAAHTSSPSTANHHTVDINEVTRSKAQEASRECKRHTGFKLELFCDSCRRYLCYKCPYDASESCPASKDGKHRPQLVANLTERQKVEIQQSICTADSLVTGVDDSIARLMQTSENVSIQREAAKAAITERETTFTSAVTQLREDVDRSSDKSQDEITKSLESLQQHRENLVNTKDEALRLLSNSVDAEIHRLAPSIVARLTAAYDFNPPCEVSIKFNPAGSDREYPDLTNMFGYLAISKETEVVFFHGEMLEGKAPTDCCTIETSAGRAVVETFGAQGLFYTAPGEVRRCIAGETAHNGVCLSLDQKVVYSTAPEKNSVLMYDVRRDRLQLKRELCIPGAVRLGDIRSHPSTGNLLVSDTGFPRITIHRPDMSTIKTIGRILKGNTILRGVNVTEWSPCSQFIYVSDWSGIRTTGIRFLPVSSKVMKLRLQPADIIWQKSTGAFPGAATPFDGRVYVAHADEPKVSVLSAEDGSVIRIIPCPGAVREVRKNKEGQIELVCY